MLIGSLESGGNLTTALTTKSTQNLKYAEALDRAKFIDHPNLDLNYMMSKRRVPNGPDPIHNRRAGNSRRPPGQS
ncbi:CLAVATA3/ESR (CLE)-related protein 25-like [Melia azedarach]|uniref:CLAVATA3/ESR (CLE)-related protein 25-like n=1 Tax=Melia azedarach TaxID=155640 RepID=A0ACC1XI78_MELAZ|nr:CLAVATA3/ESR (CLE)-related protein 25-like [Melia azedarach]